MKLLIIFKPAIVAIIFLLSCEKPPTNNGSGSQGDIKISAEVQEKVYTNNRNIKLDASKTDQINRNGQLTFSWICKDFPVGQIPKIKDATKAIAIIDSIVAGNYNFQLTVKDNFGHEAIANFAMEVFQDTLSGAPKIIPIGDQTLKLPTSLILLDASLSIFANPPNRKLEFQWSILQKPVGNRDPNINTNTHSFTYISDLEQGNYQVMLKITNEKGLSTYDTIGINVIVSPIITKVYEIPWSYTYFDDDLGPHLFMTIFDPNSFAGRTNLNTTVTILDLGTQQLLNIERVFWQINDASFYAYYYDDLTLAGKKVRVTITYQ